MTGTLATNTATKSSCQARAQEHCPRLRLSFSLAARLFMFPVSYFMSQSLRLIPRNKKYEIGDKGVRHFPARGGKVAEREGFEPPVGYPTTVFKTAALSHSAISPKRGSYIRGLCYSSDDPPRALPVTRFLPSTLI